MKEDIGKRILEKAERKRKERFEEYCRLLNEIDFEPKHNPDISVEQYEQFVNQIRRGNIIWKEEKKKKVNIWTANPDEFRDWWFEKIQKIPLVVETLKRFIKRRIDAKDKNISS